MGLNNQNRGELRWSLQLERGWGHGKLYLTTGCKRRKLHYRCFEVTSLSCGNSDQGCAGVLRFGRVYSFTIIPHETSAPCSEIMTHRIASLSPTSRTTESSLSIRNSSQGLNDSRFVGHDKHPASVDAAACPDPGVPASGE